MKHGIKNDCAGNGHYLAATVLGWLALLAGCSSFGPAPYDNPPYVLDEYGMVYGEVPSASGRSAYLVPRFSTFQSGYGDPFYDPYFAMPGASLSYFAGLRSPWHRPSPFYLGGYRPPVSYAPAPANPLIPVAESPSAAQPIASPVFTPPGVRSLPEPEYNRKGGRRAQLSGAGAHVSGAAGRSSSASRPTPARSSRSRPPRAAPPRPPTPSRPRVIDP